jgi:hypothetical protein
LAPEVNRKGAGTTEKKVGIQWCNFVTAWWGALSGKRTGQKAAAGQWGNKRIAADQEGEELLERAGHQANWWTEKKGGPGSQFLGEEVNACGAQLRASGEEHGGNGGRWYRKAVNLWKESQTLKTAAKCERSTDHSPVLLEWSALFDKEVSRLLERGDQTGMTVRPVRLSCRLMVKTTR